MEVITFNRNKEKSLFLRLAKHRLTVILLLPIHETFTDLCPKNVASAYFTL